MDYIFDLETKSTEKTQLQRKIKKPSDQSGGLYNRTEMQIMSGLAKHMIFTTEGDVTADVVQIDWINEIDEENLPQWNVLK